MTDSDIDTLPLQQTDRSNKSKITETTIYIVDDDPCVKESVSWLVESMGYNVHTFESATEFLDKFDSSKSGCLILDVRMPEMTGLALQEKLNQDNIHIPILFVTAHGDVSMAVQALKAGAMDFLTKPVHPQVLLEAVNLGIAKDRAYRERQDNHQKFMQRADKLSSRELQVTQLIVEGKSTKEIARHLNISPSTVEFHRARIMKKMGASTLPELVGITLMNGIIRVEAYGGNGE